MTIILEILLGQIPEAIYFALFIIFAKNLKEKRLLFILLMIIQTIVLRLLLPYNLWQQVDSVIITRTLLKLLYKEKSQIIDVFTFMIGSIILLCINSILYFIIWLTINNFIIYVIIARIFMILFLLIFKTKLYKIQDIYKKLWNRNDGIPKKIKSTTFRSINIVSFNTMFYLANIVLLFIIKRNVGV